LVIANRFIEMVDQLTKPSMAFAVESKRDPGHGGDLRFIRFLGQRLPQGKSTVFEKIRKIVVQGNERAGG
jgi:hypothetical protein